MNSASRIASASALAVVCLVLAVSCQGDRSSEAAGPDALSNLPAVAELVPSAPTLHPPAPPTPRFDVRCERVLPAELREKHMFGWPMKESGGPDHANCIFDETPEEPLKRIIVSLDCRQRATSEARLAELRGVYERSGMREASSPGRLAFIGSDGVPATFWDDDTECEVNVVRVGWIEPAAVETARVYAVAEALTPGAITR
jgi:hypothetical protein